MLKPLPRTHCELVRDRRPELTAAAEGHADALRGDDAPDGGRWPLGSKELERSGRAVADLQAEMDRFAEALWAAAPRRVRALPGGRALFQERLAASGRLEAHFGQVFFDYINTLNLALFERKTFFFGPDLTARLAETELNVDAALVVPPFRCCLFAFDDQATRDALYALRDDDQAAPERGLVSVYLTVLPYPGARNLILYAVHTLGEAVAMTVKRELLLRDGERVEDALRTEWKRTGPDRGGARVLTGDSETRDADDSRFYGPGLRVFRILVNAVLYLASSAPDVSGPLRAADRIPSPGPGANAKARRKAADRAARSTRLTYIEVGAGAKPLMADGAAGNGARLTTRFLVRGHWRNQAHGPGWRERKLIHIEPFWKGPDMAEAVERVYLVR